jgi:D-alanine transaminase
VLVHLNGQLLPADQARLSPFDRGFLFGDGIYEGLRACTPPAGSPRVIALQGHIDRMNQGLALAGIPWDAAQLAPLTSQLLHACNLQDAFVYWQVTRGTPDLSRGPSRSRVPGSPLTPTVFGYASPVPPINWHDPTPALKRASLQPDLRWLRGTLKSTSLLGNVLAALDAHHHHRADEALLIRDVAARKLLTEGTYTNALLVTPDAALVTPALPTDDGPFAPLLAGVTRRLLLAIEPTIVERPVDAHELDHAREIILIGTTTMITAVTHLDDRVLSAAPGPTARRLMTALVNAIAAGMDINLPGQA